MKDRIEYEESGLKCDNPKCDYVNKEVPFNIMHEHINSECPKCGENLLTEEDYNNAKKLDEIVKYVNSLTEEEVNKLSEISKELGLESMEDKKYRMVVNTHKKLSVEYIKPFDDADNL